MAEHRLPSPRSRWAGALSAVLIAAAATSLSLMTIAASAQTAERDLSSRQLVVTQKLRLLDQLLASPRSQELARGSDTAASSALARAAALLGQAQASLQAGDLPAAEKAADEALRLAGGAARGQGAPALAAGAQQARNAELVAEIGSYRQALAEAIGARADDPMPATSLAAADGMVAEAAAHTAAGRHAEANRVLTQAYRFVVLALAEVRAGQTVTLALKFDTPADEYAYEQRRFRSHEQLVALALAERTPGETARATIDRERARAAREQQRAAERAAAGDLKDAIAIMETATDHLLRALQAAGMPVLR